MDFSKSLQELDGEDWGDPKGAPTNMVARCLEARRVPLNQLSAEQCRLLLGQKIGVSLLIPIALRFLADNPMEEGTIGVRGALLQNVLRQPEDFWQAHPSLWWDVKEIVFEMENIRNAIEALGPLMREFEELKVQ